METIKNYLETMFAKLPNTSEVINAKRELGQMMEDKYNELIADGKSENEAVGTVISEFGNLEELADELGLKKEFNQSQQTTFEQNRRILTMDEVKSYLHAEATFGLRIGLGVFLCINCVIGPIIFDIIGIGESLGVISMFLMIGAAVGLFVYSGIQMNRWAYIKSGACAIDYATANYIHNERRRYSNTHALHKTIGIVLCVLCWLPCAAASEFFGNNKFADLSAVLLFLFVGFGVFLIVHSSITDSGFSTLLKINDKNTVSGTYSVPNQPEQYNSETLTTIMSVYWPTISSIYLISSFLTFDWHLTWIIWPVAAIIHSVIKSNCSKQ